MRILAVVRQVHDGEESVLIEAGRVDLSSSKLVVDTMDEYGVEQALRLRESGAATEVVALGIGPVRVGEALRAALAMGADRAVLVETEEWLDVIAASAIVAEVARREQADLILTGGQQADWDSHALGPAVAERLGWPQATWTNTIEVQGNELVGRHDVDSGSEFFRVSLPAVVTTQQGLAEPRYPTLPNILKAKRKELRRQPIEDFSIKPRLKWMNAAMQAKARRGIILDGKDPAQSSERLVDLLRNEAKVI